MTEQTEPSPEAKSAAQTTGNLGAVQGYVDTHNPPDILRGWAIQEGNPKPLRIQVLGPGGLLGEATASQYREFPPGNCEFVVKLSRPIATSDLFEQNVIIYAIDADDDRHALSIWENIIQPGTNWVLPCFTQKNISELLTTMDTNIFMVESQTSTGDQKSLLSIQNIVRNIVPHYTYLEVGSHLGGTLVPHLVDPLCRQVLSVDKRPASQPDERGMMFDYEANSTQRMLNVLKSHVPESAFIKLNTFDADVSDLNTTQIPRKVDFAFIDAEHTIAAVFRDFLGIRRFLADSFVVAFHDANLLCDGLQNIECFLKHQGIKFRSFFLPDVVFVILAGDFADISCQPLEQVRIERENFIRHSRIALWKEIAGNVAQHEGDAHTTPALRSPVAADDDNIQVSQRETLTALANWYGTDKGTTAGPAHYYSFLYDLLFADFRDRAVDFLEIGLAIGGPELGNSADRFAISPSVQMWLSYFRRATIYGFDITDFSHMQHPRFHFMQGDCGRAENLQAILQMSPHFDIIIDDASHASYHQQNTFKELFPTLRPGGLYIIEDLHWQSPYFEDSLPEVPKTFEFFDQFFTNHKYCNNQLLTEEFMEATKRQTYSFAYFRDFTGQTTVPKLIVIKKNGISAWASPEEDMLLRSERDAAIAELAARDARLADIESLLAGARAEAADGLASVRAALETAVETIGAQLDPLRAGVEYATATLDTVKEATETRVLPALERHDAALARQGRWRRALGDLASRLRSHAARTS